MIYLLLLPLHIDVIFFGVNMDEGFVSDDVALTGNGAGAATAAGAGTELVGAASAVVAKLDSLMNS